MEKNISNRTNVKLNVIHVQLDSAMKQSEKMNNQPNITPKVLLSGRHDGACGGRLIHDQATARERIRQDWKVDDDKIVIAVFGLLDVDRSDSALRRIAAELESIQTKRIWRIVVCGLSAIEWLGAEFESHNARGVGPIQFVRTPEAIQDLFDAVDILLLPTVSTECDRLACDAEAAGLPVVKNEFIRAKTRSASMPNDASRFAHDLAAIVNDQQYALSLCDAGYRRFLKRSA